MSSTPFYIPRPSTSSVSSAFDFKHLGDLTQAVKSKASTDPAAQKEVAQQFEALFIQLLLKQARQSNVGLEGAFESDQTRMARSLSDEQVAMQMAQSGMGLSQALLAQMQGQSQYTPDIRIAADRGLPSASLQKDVTGGEKIADSISELLDLLSRTPAVSAVKEAGAAFVSAIRGAPPHIENFVVRMGEAARQASAQTGVPAKLILSQAALESGWGQREIRGADGTNSYNLFGIKATSGWTGKVVNVVTTEYVNGQPQKMVQPFRAYDSYADAFADYARLISQSDRYQDVMQAPNAESAAVRIQQAGYATDPNYADKLISIMGYLDEQRVNTQLARGVVPRNSGNI